jgi:subtilisin-like proprotein convertase family protein
MPEYIPDDPLFAQQWHLRNTGQTGFGPGNLDLNVTRVWPDYTGAGVTIVVYDNGVDYNHEDLNDNYDASRHVIIDGVQQNAFWQPPSAVSGTTGYNAINAHGTGLAGIAAAEDNNVGGVGVAFDATLVGVYAPVTGVTAPSSLLVQGMQQLGNFDVGLFSAGPTGFRDSQGSANWTAFYAAITSAAANGRDGLGTILVNGTHNGGPGFGGTDANSSQFDSSRFFIHNGAVTDQGVVAPNVTRGATMLVSAFTGFAAPGSARNIWSTDISGPDGVGPGDYTSGGGTSSAAPQVAGVAALMLQANPGLGWRDVQNILANSARHTGSAVGGPPDTGATETDAWEFNGSDNWNGGGRHYSIDYGYGIVDALAAVRMAETWAIGAPGAATSANQAARSVSIDSGGVAIPDNTGASVTLNYVMAENIRLEDVRLNLAGLNHTRVNDLHITLTSPSGTVSKIFNPVVAEATNQGVSGGWAFVSEEFRGEASQGTWQVTITDLRSGNTGTLGASTLNFFGASNTTTDRYTYTDEFSAYASLAGRNILGDTDGGTDTINAAAVTTGSTINLNNGSTSTIAGQSLTIAAGSDIENAVGGDGNDTFTGNALANIFYGGRGDDIIDGGGDIDSAVFAGLRSAYTLTALAGTGVRVVGPHGTDTLSNVERLVFDDQTVTWPSVAGSVAVDDVSVTEGDNGTTVMTFTVTRSGGEAAFAVNYAAADGTATLADSDYGATSGTLSFGAGVNTQTISVAINGDTRVESDETLFVTLSGGTNGATISDSQGQGTIVNDDSPVSPNTGANLIGGLSYGIHSLTWQLQATGDLDHDGDADLLWRNTSSGEVTAWFMQNGQHVGDASYGNHLLAWQLQATGDLNGDGTADILWRNTSSGEVTSWFMQNGQRVGGASYGTHLLDWQAQATGDLNGDGTADVLWRNTASGEVTSWIMQNGQRVGDASYGIHSLDWRVQGAGDLNGDGTADVVWRNTASGQATSWLMQNGAHAGDRDYGIHNLQWQVQDVGDLNGDGTADIFWRNTASGQATSWLMDGGGGHAGDRDYGVHALSWQEQALGDINHDGSADVLWRNLDSDEATSWLLSPA